jgi:3-oxoadipate enol-lactonase
MRVLRAASGLKYFESGKGPETIIFHPSLGLGRFLFYRMIAPLSRSFRVVAYDPRGFGDNQALEPNLEAWVSDVGELMASSSGPCHLIGVSLGTWVMSRAAVRWPERVGRLVLMGTTPGFADGAAAVAARREALRQTTMAEFAREYADSTLTRFAYAEVKDQLIEDLKRAGPDNYLEAMSAIYLADNRTVFTEIAAPTIVITGALDTRTPPSAGEQATRLIPHSTLRVVSNAGHLVLLDQPGRVEELVNAFIAGEEIDD